MMQGDVYDKDKQTVCPECGSDDLIMKELRLFVKNVV